MSIIRRKFHSNYYEIFKTLGAFKSCRLRWRRRRNLPLHLKQGDGDFQAEKRDCNAAPTRDLNICMVMWAADKLKHYGR